MFRLPACCAAASTSSGAGAVAAAGREAPGATPPSHIFRRGSGRVPRLLRIYSAFASVRLFRLLLSFAFHHELMGARRTTRTRRANPASSWRQSRTGMSQSCAPKSPSILAHSDGKRASGWAHTRLELGAASAGRSVRTGKQHGRCALHAGCMCAAFGCRVASRKPLPAARLCGTTAIVRPWIRHGMPLETRTRATRMHAEYGWPCYAARLRPRSTGLGWWAQVNFQALQHDPET